jgi:response regulator RpfG family c-di-GMP phosphodiesterase
MAEEIRLLLVDDHKQYHHFKNTIALDKCFQKQFSVQSAISIDEAKATVYTWYPHIIIFDSHTSISTSIELIDSWKDLAFILITSNSFSKDIEETVIAHGASAYLTLPNSTEDLEILLSELSILPLKSNQIQ